MTLSAAGFLGVISLVAFIVIYQQGKTYICNI